MAGAQGAGLQRGQDPHRASRRRGGLSGIQRPPLPRQAADQTEQGGGETDPGTADRRDESPARTQRAAWCSSGSTPSSGAGRPTTGMWCPPRCSGSWTTTCGNSPTSGRSSLHPHKGKRWIAARYFGAFNPARRDRWVFGDRDSGAYLLKFAWTQITRHTLVKGWASPDDPALADYWAARRRRGRPPLDRARLRLILNDSAAMPALRAAAAARRRTSRAPRRMGAVDHSDQQGVRPTTRESSSTQDPSTADPITVFRLIHTHCRDRQPDGTGSTASTTAAPS